MRGVLWIFVSSTNAVQLSTLITILGTQKCTPSHSDREHTIWMSCLYPSRGDPPKASLYLERLLQRRRARQVTRGAGASKSDLHLTKLRQKPLASLSLWGQQWSMLYTMFYTSHFSYPIMTSCPRCFLVELAFKILRGSLCFGWNCQLPVFCKNDRRWSTRGAKTHCRFSKPLRKHGIVPSVTCMCVFTTRVIL